MSLDIDDEKFRSDMEKAICSLNESINHLRDALDNCWDAGDCCFIWECNAEILRERERALRKWMDEWDIQAEDIDDSS